MGDKRARERQRFRVHLAGCLIFAILLAGCAAGPSTPWSPVPAETPARHLALCECRLIEGDYDGARKEAERVLAQFAGWADDRALLLLGMVLAHPDNPQCDAGLAADTFRRLLDGYPDSPLVVDARTWLALIARFEERARALAHLETTAAALKEQLAVETEKRLQLEERLQQLKAIDLMAD